MLARVALASLLAAAALTLAACESSQIPDWMQARPASRPQPAAPPPAGAPPAVPAPAAPVPGEAAPPTVAPGGVALLPAPGRVPGPVPAPPAPRRPATGSVRVAMLLPLTGRWSEVGHDLMNAAQLALFDFADDRFEMVVHDTRSTGEGATESARQALRDGAELILGPFLAPEVRAVAPAARAARVNVVTFSPDRTVAGNGVFVMGFLPDAEVERVVSFARGRGLRRFALMAPDDDYGRAVQAALVRSAERNGGQVARVHLYDPNITDYAGTVRRLANYESRRAALEAQRRELEASGDEVAKKALARLEQLQTMGDLAFDALLIADGGKRLQGIAAFLPHFDVDPSRVRMLGTRLWDAPDSGSEPALIGGWFAAPPPEARVDFANRYREAYGKASHRLASLAYDATALAAVLARGESPDPFGVDALTQPSGFAGSDGIFRFRRDGLAERGLAVLEVGSRGAKVISKAPESFAPPTN